MSNEEIIWNYFKKEGLTDAGIAGLMGNLYAESKLKSTNLQNSYEKKLGFNDESYTKAVDNKTYNNFIRDSAGYGLAQWTYWTRKEKLLNFAKEKNKSIGDIYLQLDFLMIELNNNYPEILKTLKTTTSVNKASKEVLTKFEKPADQGVLVQRKRASFGKQYYNKYAKKTFISLEEENKMKYNENNPPLICMQTNSTCYKNTKSMIPVGVLWHSTGANNPYLKRYVQPLSTDKNYKEMIKLLGVNDYNNDWNHIERQAGLNCWIGKTANETITTIQTMPWNWRPWGCGSGPKGSCNNGWIQFEICEDDLNNKDYFDKVYKEACEVTAYLCKMYNLNPHGTVKMNNIDIPVILCHADSWKLGVGSNHGDVLYWFKKFGKTMDDVRNDVAKIIKSDSTTIIPTSPTAPTIKPNINQEEEEMTQEQFNTMMNTWITEQAKKEAGSWSAEARKWGEKNGLISGDSNGNKMYKKILTREEFITVLYRALHRNIID